MIQEDVLTPEAKKEDFVDFYAAQLKRFTLKVKVSWPLGCITIGLPFLLQAQPPAA